MAGREDELPALRLTTLCLSPVKSYVANRKRLTGGVAQLTDQLVPAQLFPGHAGRPAEARAGTPPCRPAGLWSKQQPPPSQNTAGQTKR